jgi:hypothetical protein
MQGFRAHHSLCVLCASSAASGPTLSFGRRPLSRGNAGGAALEPHWRGIRFGRELLHARGVGRCSSAVHCESIRKKDVSARVSWSSARAAGVRSAGPSAGTPSRAQWIQCPAARPHPARHKERQGGTVLRCRRALPGCCRRMALRHQMVDAGRPGYLAGYGCADRAGNRTLQRLSSRLHDAAERSSLLWLSGAAAGRAGAVWRLAWRWVATRGLRRAPPVNEGQ